MSSEGQPANLTVLIDAGDQAEQIEIDCMARQLLAELAGANVESAELVTTEAPEGTRSMGAVTVGALAIAVLPVFIEKLVEFLIEWSKRDDRRAITIKTQIAGESVEVSFNPGMTSVEDIRRFVRMLYPGSLAG
jgi:hypothetical protein